MSQLNPAKLFNQALQLFSAGQLPKADRVCRQILSFQPQNIDALNLIGAIANQTNRPADGLPFLQAALRINPNFPQAQYNLGNAYLTLGQFDDAVAAYHAALAMKPNYPEVLTFLGLTHYLQRRFPEAIATLQKAIAQRPTYIEPHKYLGDVYHKTGDTDQFIATHRRALSLLPTTPPYPPIAAELHNSFACGLYEVGMREEALRHSHEALRMNPSFTLAHSNFVYNLMYHPDFTPQAILQEHQRWYQQHAAHLAVNIPPHTNDRSPDRRLRIGYVSPDFRNHCQALFTIPVLSHHDHANFEIVCYSRIPRPDDITHRLRGYADLWRESFGLSHDQLAQQIRADQIDILVDLTMHMAKTHLPALARKPAPVQVAWLAYPGTTGMQTIDYRLTDPYLDPLPPSTPSAPGSAGGTNNASLTSSFPPDCFYTEKSFRLPDTFWCYDPLTTEPAINPLPALTNHHITFGCFNNFCKINDPVLSLWSRVLLALPTSRLLLLAPEGAHRQHVLNQLNVNPSRIEFVTKRPRAEYLQLYHRVDLCLDTFPYNGHTTSLDSFWMGVPVITLVGSTVVGRAGLCQLMNLNLPELIAHTPDDFVRIATNLAQDLPRLTELRATLRTRMEASPLMDAPRFTRNLEAAYREMWKNYCAAG